MARTYLHRGKVTRQVKEQGVNFIERKRGERPVFGWTNTRQAILVTLTPEVYNDLMTMYKLKQDPHHPRTNWGTGESRFESNKRI